MSYISKDEGTKNLISAIENTCRAGLVPLLWGLPGIGKTALIRALAAKHNLPLHILIPSTMDPADVNGLPALKHITVPGDGGEEVEAIVTENTLQYWAEDLIRRGEGILFFDEASTAPPAVQAALLSVLQGRLVSGRKLPDKVWMVAAANEATDAADGWELAPPLANRFAHLQVRFNQEAWLEGMAVNFNRPYENEYERSRQVFERSRITGFIKSPMGAQFALKMPSTAAESGKAWPSPRSWDNLANALANIDPNAGGEDDRRSASAVRHMLIEAFVGQQAANEFMTFSDSLDLPSTQEVLDGPEKIDWDSMSSSEVYIIVQSIIPILNESNVEKVLKVFEFIVENHSKHKDVVIGRAYVLIDAMAGIPRGATLITKSLHTFLPAMGKAGMLDKK